MLFLQYKLQLNWLAPLDTDSVYNGDLGRLELEHDLDLDLELDHWVLDLVMNQCSTMYAEMILHCCFKFKMNVSVIYELPCKKILLFLRQMFK